MRWIVKVPEIRKNITPEDWSFLAMDIHHNRLRVYDYAVDDDNEESPVIQSGFTNISVSVDELLALYPPEKDAVDNEIGIVGTDSVKQQAYSTSFIKLMHEAIEHFKIMETHQVGTKQLIPWFEEKLRALGEISPNNKAKMMATFVRLPEAQKGGNKRAAK